MNAPSQATSTLEKADLRLLREVYLSNQEFGIAYLPPPRRQARTKRLAEAGLLEDCKVRLAPNPDGWIAVKITQAGVDAYNAAVATQWGAA